MSSEKGVQSWNGQHIDARLNGIGLFRKHIVRDSNSLFRAVANVVYYSQTAHYQIRKQCADFIRDYGIKYLNWAHDRDKNDHVGALYREDTPGDMNDVMTMSILFRRDFVVFDMQCVPDTSCVNGYNNTIYMLYQSAINHFDLLIPMERVRTTACCQSLAYKAIYQGVFSMVDVDYATNMMLSDSNFDGAGNMGLIKTDTKVTISIEKYSQKTNFASVSAKEMLFNNLIPYPYKVARGLSPHIYKNLEYDVWSEFKKEKELIGSQCLKVGLKCLCKMNKDQKTPYVCYIQEIRSDSNQCIVYIEELGEKVILTVNQLQPLPFDEAKPWHLMTTNKRNKYFKKCIKNKKGTVQEATKYAQNKNKVVFKTRIIEKNQSFAESEKDSNNNEVNDWEVYKMKSDKHQLITKMEYSTFKPYTVDFIAVPFTVEHTPTGVSNGATQDAPNLPSRSNNGVNTTNTNTYTYMHYSPPPLSNSPEMNTTPGPYVSPSNPNPSLIYQNAPIGAGSPYPSHFQPMFCVPPIPMQPLRPVGPINLPYPINRSAFGPVNLSAQRSMDINGSDLPHDVPTLRYFYNMGVEFALSGGLPWIHHPPPPTIAPMHASHNFYPQPSVNQLALEMQSNLTLEDSPQSQACSPREQQKNNNNNTQYKNNKYNDFRNGRGGGPGGRYRRNDNNYHPNNKTNGNNRGNNSNPKKGIMNNIRCDGERNQDKKEQEQEQLSNSPSVTPNLPPIPYPPPTFYRYPDAMIAQNYPGNFLPYNPAMEEAAASPAIDGNFIPPVNLPPPPFVYYAPQQPMYISQNLPQNANYVSPNHYPSQTPDSGVSK